MKRIFDLSTVELLLIITMVGLLLTYAMPDQMSSENKVKEANLSKCQQNLRILNLAKEEWLKKHGDYAVRETMKERVLSMQDVHPFMYSVPVCPSNGRYGLGTIGKRAFCTIHGSRF